MRSIGIVLILIGALIAYLGYKGKVADAWQALLQGQASVPSSPPVTKGPTTAGGVGEDNKPPTISDPASGGVMA